jgi:type II secretory pathway component GspD/PulD (secretin)
MKKLILIALALVPLLALARDDGPKAAGNQTAPAVTSVTVSAKGADVRGVLHDLFTQAKKNYVLQPGVQFVLFLQLENVDFEEALNIVCSQAKLSFEVQNGIYFVSKAKTVIAPATPPAPKGKLDKSVLTHALATHFAKTDIRIVFAEFAKQTQVAIEVDKSVPAYKLDCLLKKTTLQKALDKVCEAAGLKYKFTENLTIEVYKPETDDKVGITGG